MFFRISIAIILASILITCLYAQQMDEYSVKAAFLYNFAKFVDWPADAFHSPDEPFAICILGHDPFGQAMDDVVAGKTISGRPVQVRRLSNAHETGGCRVLFLSASEPKRVLSVIAAAKQPNLLTVGEAGSMTAEGVIIAFALEGGKVRFGINRAEADEEKLRLSSKLLSLAMVAKY